MAQVERAKVETTSAATVVFILPPLRLIILSALISAFANTFAK
jgi:hypothetical protein